MNCYPGLISGVPDLFLQSSETFSGLPDETILLRDVFRSAGFVLAEQRDVFRTSGRNNFATRCFPECRICSCRAARRFPDFRTKQFCCEMFSGVPDLFLQSSETFSGLPDESILLRDDFRITGFVPAEQRDDFWISGRICFAASIR